MCGRVTGIGGERGLVDNFLYRYTFIRGNLPLDVLTSFYSGNF